MSIKPHNRKQILQYPNLYREADSSLLNLRSSTFTLVKQEPSWVTQHGNCRNIYVIKASLRLIHRRYCLEHGLGFDGKPDPDSKVADVGSRDTFFTESSTDKFVPRSIFVDLDPSPLDEIRTGKYRQLFHPELLISGKEDASNNYARGHYTVGRDLIEDVLEKIRRVAGGISNVCNVLVGC